jgi:predicted membrane chloride channel (bestrophin family)
MDVLLNVSGRPPLGWKMLWIIAISCVFVYIGEHNLSGYDFLDEGIDKDTVTYLTFGLAFLLTWRLGQSYVRYNDARVRRKIYNHNNIYFRPLMFLHAFSESKVKWGMMVNRTRDLTRQFWGYCSDKTINQRATKWIIAYVHVSLWIIIIAYAVDHHRCIRRPASSHCVGKSNAMSFTIFWMMMKFLLSTIVITCQFTAWSKSLSASMRPQEKVSCKRLSVYLA